MMIDNKIIKFLIIPRFLLYNCFYTVCLNCSVNFFHSRARYSELKFLINLFWIVFIFSGGPVSIARQIPEIGEVEKQLSPKLEPGGRGFPLECEARYRVAIVVPYRARPQHLLTLLYNIHPVLLRQQIDYTIFIVEQEGK